jgi:tight adherence protein B
VLTAAAEAAGAGQSFDLRRVDVSSYPVVNLVVRSHEAAAKPIVFENGAAVTGVERLNLGQSKAVVLAIDRSRSMKGAPLDEATAAAQRFVQRKRHADRVAVVTFGAKALKQAPLAQSTIDADNVLRNMSSDPVEGTALFDAVVVSSAELGGQTLPGRVLVVLTDGRDIGSIATFGDALRAARKAHVVVYAIALGDVRTRMLRALARGTGGAVYVSPKPADLERVFQKIGTDLNRTWGVSYTTSARPGDSIAVSVGSPKAPEQSAVIPGKRSSPSGGLLPGTLVNGAGSVALIVLAFAAFLYLAVRQAQLLPRAARIKRLVHAHTDPRGRSRVKVERRRPTLATAIAAVDRRLHRLRRWKRIERLTETAAVPASASTVLLGAVVLAILLALLVALGGGSVFLVFVAFVGGLLIPFVVLKLIGAHRVRTFEDQLPEVLATIASSLKVGHGLKAALQTIADEGAPPTSVEFRRVLAEARLGRPLEEALVSMCERLGSEDLLYVATAVDVQSQVGGSLAGVFGTVAETVRQRQHHRAKVRALTATGRASATVLSLFPLAMVVLLLIVNPSYMLPFLQSGIGHVLMTYSVISLAIGALILNRLVSVKE